MTYTTPTATSTTTATATTCYVKQVGLMSGCAKSNIPSKSGSRLKVCGGDGLMLCGVGWQ